MVAEQNGYTRMITFDVGTTCILIPDAVEHGLAAGCFVFVGELGLDFLECFCSRVHTAPSLQIDGSRIVVGEKFHNSVGTRRVGPIGRVDDGFGTRKKMACGRAIELHVVGILITDEDHAAQIVGSGVLGVVNLEVGINLLIGIELLGKPGLAAPSVTLVARIALDDGCHFHHTGHTADSFLLMWRQDPIVGVGQWFGSLT